MSLDPDQTWLPFHGALFLIQNEIHSKNNRHQRHAQKSSTSSTNHSSVSSSTPPSQSSTNSMSYPQAEPLRRPSTGTNSTSSTNGPHPSKPHRSNSVLSSPTTGHSRGAKSSRDFEMNEDPNGILGSSSLPTTPSEGAVGRFRKWSQKSGRGRSGSASTATSNSSPSGNQGAGAGGSQSVGNARRPSGENNGSDGPDMFSASFVSGDDQEVRACFGDPAARFPCFFSWLFLFLASLPPPRPGSFRSALAPNIFRFHLSFFCAFRFRYCR